MLKMFIADTRCEIQMDPQHLSAIFELIEHCGVMAYITDPATDDVIYVTSRARYLLGIDENASERDRLGFSLDGDVLRSDERSRKKLVKDPSGSFTLDEYSPATGKFFKRTDSAFTWVDGTVLHIHVLNEVAEGNNECAQDDSLEREREARESFLVNMSHDLRSHLNSILGMVSAAEDVSDIDKIHTAVDRIALVSMDMMTMLDDILDMSGIESLAGCDRLTSTSTAPQRQEMKIAMREAREKSARLLRSIGGCTVLLVEDIDLHREIVRLFLEGTDISIDVAADGREAVEMFSRDPERYSLILMDVNLPVMSGYEAAKAIRALPDAHAKSIPMIAITANALIEDESLSFAAGMNGHITKPLDRTDFLSLLVYHLKDKIKEDTGD